MDDNNIYKENDGGNMNNSNQGSDSNFVEKKEENSMKVLVHVLGWFTYFIGPLIFLLVTKEEKVKQHAKKALNWQISLIIYLIISFILVFVLIGFLLIFVLIIMDIIFCIMAAVKANKDELWDYPFAIPFLK